MAPCAGRGGAALLLLLLHFVKERLFSAPQQEHAAQRSLRVLREPGVRLVPVLFHVDVYVCGSSHMAADGPRKVKAGGVSLIGQLPVHLLDALGSKGSAWFVDRLFN